MPTSKPRVSPKRIGAAGRIALLAAALPALGACMTYEPPKPGVYAEVGVRPAPTKCAYEAVTGTRIAQVVCRQGEDEMTRRMRDALDLGRGTQGQEISGP